MSNTSRITILIAVNTFSHESFKNSFHFQMSNTLFCLKSEISNTREIKKYVSSQFWRTSILHTHVGIENRFQNILVQNLSSYETSATGNFLDNCISRKNFWTHFLSINFYVKSGSPNLQIMNAIYPPNNCSYLQHENPKVRK